MQTVFSPDNLLMPLEMLLVNLFVIDRCIARRHGRWVTWLVMSAFVVVLTLGALCVLRRLPGFGNGNGFFIFFGMLFLIPVKILYDGPVVKVVFITCTSWTYTFLLFALSVHGGRLIAGLPFDIAAILLQTALYVLTLRWFYHTLKNSLLYMLAQLSPRNNLYLMWISILYFWTVFVVNLVFVYPDVMVLRVLSLLTLSLGITTSYRYIRQLVSTSQMVRTLEHIAYHDDLTQLRGRALLYSDGDRLLESGTLFRLVFIDLDRFKLINDRYGHATGDAYLAFFAQTLLSRLENQGQLYRVSGDEFVCLFTGLDFDHFMQAVRAMPRRLPDRDVPFLGFSYGVALHPQDAATMEELIQTADARMYEMKERNVQARV